MDRRRGLQILALLLLAGASRWLLVWLQGDGDPGAALPLARSDYTLESFDLMVMNRDGIPSFQVRSPYLERSPDDGSVDLTEPVVHLFDEGRQSWRIDAQEGWIRPDGEELELRGEVTLDRLAPRELTIRTQNLRIFPETDRAQSDWPVRIQRPGVVLEGVGIEAWLDSERIEILSDVEGTYDPKSPAS